jgi:hypothetical protein
MAILKSHCMYTLILCCYQFVLISSICSKFNSEHKVSAVHCTTLKRHTSFYLKTICFNSAIPIAFTSVQPFHNGQNAMLKHQTLSKISEKLTLYIFHENILLLYKTTVCAVVTS